jgi:uncharacterized protein
VKLETTLHTTFSTIDPAEWDALVPTGSPFVRHAYLWALEASGSAAPGTGWRPAPIVVHRNARPVAAAPAWVVEHDRGQFVWERHWRRALARAGRPLYPKLVVTSPLTPVEGARLLVADRADEGATGALLEAIVMSSRPFGSWHLHFADATSVGLAAGAFAREQFQYRWRDEGFEDFDGFLAALNRHRRKEIRRERAALQDLRFERIDRPSPEILDHAWACYAHTAARHGERLLTRALFETLGAVWSERLVVNVAWDGRRAIGAAVAIEDGDALFGRWAGQLEARPFLHFELCYYQGIERCLERGLRRFDPGHGGDHKLVRGFAPVPVHSLHAFHDPQVHAAFAAHAADETDLMRAEMARQAERSSLRAAPRGG